MADELTEETEPTQPRFQFRLRSIFILMGIIAFSFGLVPAWYQQVIIPSELSVVAQGDPAEDPYPYRLYETQISNIYTPFFCVIGFASSCGLWYALVSWNKRLSDVWLGVAFGLTLGFVVWPRFWAIPYLFRFDVSLAPFDLVIRLANHKDQPTLYALLPALLYSFWPLFLKRYAEAIMLFLYTWFYGVIVSSYVSRIIIDRMY